MDIEYLLLLQSFRNGIGSFLAPFLMWASDFAISFWPLAMIFMLYWVLDRKTGRKILLGYGLSNLVNGFLKLTFCIYRPWIKDARVLPYGDSKVTATGYSFPSGHSTCATSTIGNIGIWFYKNSKKLLSFICWLFVAIVLFSRNYLGVHTPQDVLVGFASTIIVVVLANKIEDWTDKDDKRDMIVLIVGILLCLLLALYYEIKPYPLTYLDDGSLLVDPNKMKGDSYQGIGFVIMYVISRYFEKRGFDFENKLDYRDRFIIGIFALIPLYIWINTICPLFVTITGKSVSCFIQFGMYSFYALVLVPNIMKVYYNRKNK